MQPKHTLLVVDDQPSNIQVIRSYLESQYDLLSATNGMDALALAREARPDIVLLDISMPGMDGYSVLASLRADPSIAHIPVIFVTGNTDQNSILKVLRGGGDDYITKPVNEVELIHRIENQLQVKRLRSEVQQKQMLSAKMEMLKMLAHQWRQPLTAIGSGLMLLETEIEAQESVGENPVTARIDAIDQVLQQLSQTINQAMVVIESDTQLVSIDIDELFDAVQHAHQSVLDESGILLEMNVDGPICCTSDRSTLLQTLTLLMENAIEATLESRTSCIRLQAARAGEQIEISVTNTGTPISEADMNRIYEPYFTTKQELNGKGVGLYLAKMQTELRLGGSIAARNEADGVTFTVTLPLSIEQGRYSAES